MVVLAGSRPFRFGFSPDSYNAPAAGTQTAMGWGPCRRTNTHTSGALAVPHEAEPRGEVDDELRWVILCKGNHGRGGGPSLRGSVFPFLWIELGQRWMQEMKSRCGKKTPDLIGEVGKTSHLVRAAHSGHFRTRARLPRKETALRPQENSKKAYFPHWVNASRNGTGDENMMESQ